MHPIVSTFIQQGGNQIAELILDNVNVEHLARSFDAGLAALNTLSNNKRRKIEPVAKLVHSDHELQKAYNCVWDEFVRVFRLDTQRGFKGELYAPEHFRMGELFVRAHYLIALGGFDSEEDIWSTFLAKGVELESFAEGVHVKLSNAVDIFAAIKEANAPLVSGKEAQVIREAFREISKTQREVLKQNAAK